MPVPTSVRWAVYASWAVFALGTLRTTVTVLLNGDLVDAWIGASPSRRQWPREVVVEGAPQFTGVALIGLTITALLAVAAIFVLRRAKWARVAAILLAALSLIGGVVPLLTPSVVVLQVVHILIALLSVGVFILLLGGSARRFFASD